MVFSLDWRSTVFLNLSDMKLKLPEMRSLKWNFTLVVVVATAKYDSDGFKISLAMAIL